MDEKYLEQADRVVQVAREAAVSQAQRAVAGVGQADCEDCGEPIPPARRVAFPAAVRCFWCQSSHEAQNRFFLPRG